MSLLDRAQALEQTDLARTCLDAGRAEEALSFARSALRLDPDSFAARFVEATALLALRRAADAMRSLDALTICHTPAASRPDVAMLRAQALAAADCLDQAVHELLSFAVRFPDDVRAHRLLATVHLRRNDPAQAAQALREVLRLEPSNSSARRTLANLLAPHAPQQAADLLMGTPPAARSDAASLAAAQWYIRAGREADARACFDALLEQHPDDGTVLLAAGQLADHTGEHDAAIQHLTRAAEQPGSHRARALAALAAALMHAGRFAPAGRVWWKLTCLAPHDARAWTSLAVCAARCGRPSLMDRALSRCDRLDREPGTIAPARLAAEGWLHTVAARALLDAESGITEPAAAPTPLTDLIRRSLHTLSSTAAAHPTWADSHYHAAVCHAALGEQDDAQHLVQAALDINPNYHAAVTLAGRLATMRRAA